MIEFPPKKIISSIPATWDGLRYFPEGGGIIELLEFGMIE